LKALPKSISEKKPIRVTPLSNSLQIQMALKMKTDNQINETENSEEDDD
jgi:hypothetical protein